MANSKDITEIQSSLARTAAAQLVSIAELIAKLKAQIITKQSTMTAERKDILDAALKQLNKYEKEHDATRSWELYLTIKEIFLIVSATQKGKDNDLLREHVRRFFQRREHLFKNDAAGLNNSTPGNTFCLDIAKILFSNENATNVLLSDATTKDRAEPWMDMIECKTELPELGYFFTNEAGQIHLYNVVLDRAITQLKAGYSDPKQVWMGSDAKSADSSNRFAAYDSPLSDSDLEIVAGRTPTFRVLVDYTKKLDMEIKEQKKTPYDRFHDLRVGLLKGDVEHGGEELNAGTDANVAVVEFAEWWNTLDKTTQEKIRALEVKPSIYGRNRMADILDIILDDSNANKRNSVVYCIKLKGQRLDELLSNQEIRNALISLHNYNKNPRVSDENLDEWQQAITSELDTVQANIQQKNSLEIYTQSKGIILQTLINNLFDYRLLHDSELSQRMHDWNQKYPLNLPHDFQQPMMNIIGDIYSITSSNQLLLLYAHYRYDASNTIILTAIKHRLYDLCAQNNIPYENLRKEFPFFDSIGKHDEKNAVTMIHRSLQTANGDANWQAVRKFFANSRLNAQTQPILLELFQIARVLRPADSEFLEKVLMRDIIRREIDAYENKVSKRLGHRQSPQRQQSIAKVKMLIYQPLDNFDHDILSDHLVAQLRETIQDHKKGLFSRFTKSNLAESYVRALKNLKRIDPNYRERISKWKQCVSSVLGGLAACLSALSACLPKFLRCCFKGGSSGGGSGPNGGGGPDGRGSSGCLPGSNRSSNRGYGPDDDNLPPPPPPAAAAAVANYHVNQQRHQQAISDFQRNGHTNNMYAGVTFASLRIIIEGIINAFLLTTSQARILNRTQNVARRSEPVQQNNNSGLQGAPLLRIQRAQLGNYSPHEASHEEHENQSNEASQAEHENQQGGQRRMLLRN